MRYHWRRDSLCVTRKFLLLTYECDITLQANVFITSDELVSASHLQIRNHTADEC